GSLAVVTSELRRPAGLASFVEIRKQPGSAAVARFGERQHCVQLACRQAFVAVVGFREFDQAPLLYDIGEAVGHPGLGGEAIAPSAAGFLEVALDRSGHVEM